MEPLVPPQTDNAPMPETTHKRSHRVLFVMLAVVFGSLYVTFNIWVYQYSKSGKAPVPEKIWQTVTEKGAGFGGFQSESRGRIPTPAPRLSSPPAATPAPTSTPTPTPRPTGPGPFACAPDGTCNRYGDEVRGQSCPVTFADDRCLDQCADTEKRCSK